MNLLSPALSGAVGVVLLGATTAHLVRPTTLPRALAAHRVLPLTAPATRTLIAALMVAIQGLLGVLLVAAALGWGGAGVARGSALAAMVLGAAMAGYLILALRRNPAGEPIPCGCGVGEAPLSTASVLRAVLLAAMAAVAAAAVPTGYRFGELPAQELAVLGAAICSLAIPLALLPAARSQPVLTIGAGSAAASSGVLR